MPFDWELVGQYLAVLEETCTRKSISKGGGEVSSEVGSEEGSEESSEEGSGQSSEEHSELGLGDGSEEENSGGDDSYQGMPLLPFCYDLPFNFNFSAPSARPSKRVKRSR